MAASSRCSPGGRGIRKALARFDNLRLLRITEEESAALTALAERQMRLQCTIQDGQLWFTGEEASAEVTPQTLDPSRF